jgi:hypothetical protein
MAEWKFGKLLASNWSQEPQKGYIENSPEAGKSFRREMFTDINKLRTGSVILEKGVAQEFENWFKNTIKQGTIPFDIYDCYVGFEREARFYDGSYKMVDVGGLMRLTFKLQFTPVDVVETFNLVDDLGNNLVDDLANQLIAETKLEV